MRLLPLLLISNICTAQITYTVGAGMGLTNVNPQAMIEAGGRPLNPLYCGVQMKGRYSNYPALSAGIVTGFAWSWNNGKGHELTTIFLAKYDVPLLSSEYYKTAKPPRIGYGIRHYVYQGWVEGGLEHSQVYVTLGYSFREIYR